MQQDVTKNYIMGIIFTAIITLMSMMIIKIPIFQELRISPLIVGILLGVLCSFIYKNISVKCDKGVTFSAKKILRFGIILYGFNVSFVEIGQVGFVGILACIVVVCVILCVGIWLGVKLFGLDKDLAILVSGGSAICGAAAVLALESSLKSEPHKGIIAVGTVVIFGLLSMFAYPILYAGGLIPFNHAQEGLYIGLTLHEVANVIGASGSISPECATYALITKMIRVILLIPVLLLIPFLFTTNNTTKNTRKIDIPWFVFLFLGVIALHTFIEFPKFVVDGFTYLCAFCLTMAMVALGLQIDFKKFKNAGGGAFKLAFILFLLLVVGGFFLVKGLVFAGLF